jgi:hypothetical protein
MYYLKRFFETLTRNKPKEEFIKVEKISFTRARGYREELYISRRFEVKHGNLSQAAKQLNMALNEGIFLDNYG